MRPDRAAPAPSERSLGRPPWAAAQPRTGSMGLPGILDRAIVVYILAVLVWAPVPVASNRAWSSALLVLLIALGGVLSAIRLLRASHRHRLSAPQGGWLLLALLLSAQAWVAIQWLGGFTTDTGATFRALTLGCAYSLLYLLILVHFATRRRLTLLLAALTVSGLAQAFYGSFMALSGIEWLAWEPKRYGLGVVTGTFVNSNHLAGYLEMTLACGLGLLMALRTGQAFRWYRVPELLIGSKVWIRLALAIMVIALVMSRSRMGNTAFFSSLLLVGGIFVLAHREHRLRNALILASLLLIDLLIVSQFFGLQKLQDKLLGTQLEDQVVQGQVVRRENVDRDDILIYALPQLRDRPLIGFGAGSFEASFQAYPGPDIKGHFEHAHNDFLQFAIEFGLIGTLPLALFTLWSLALALKAMVRPGSLYRSGLGLGAATGILALLIHSFTDFNLQIPANAATFITLCAIAVLANNRRTRSAHRAANPGGPLG